MKKQKQIEVVCKEYEPYSDVIEEIIENAEVHERQDENISVNYGCIYDVSLSLLGGQLVRNI